MNLECRVFALQAEKKERDLSVCLCGNRAGKYFCLRCVGEQGYPPAAPRYRPSFFNDYHGAAPSLTKAVPSLCAGSIDSVMNYPRAPACPSPESALTEGREGPVCLCGHGTGRPFDIARGVILVAPLLVSVTTVSRHGSRRKNVRDER